MTPAENLKPVEAGPDVTIKNTTFPDTVTYKRHWFVIFKTSKINSSLLKKWRHPVIAVKFVTSLDVCQLMVTIWTKQQPKLIFIQQKAKRERNMCRGGQPVGSPVLAPVLLERWKGRVGRFRPTCTDWILQCYVMILGVFVARPVGPRRATPCLPTCTVRPV
jgi:hypothetical protein